MSHFAHQRPRPAQFGQVVSFPFFVCWANFLYPRHLNHRPWLNKARQLTRGMSGGRFCTGHRVTHLIFFPPATWTVVAHPQHGVHRINGDRPPAALRHMRAGWPLWHLLKFAPFTPRHPASASGSVFASEAPAEFQRLTLLQQVTQGTLTPLVAAIPCAL